MTIEEQKEAMRTAMRDSLMQQVQTLLKFDGAAAFALQVPDTDIVILAGPQHRIAGYLATTTPYGDAGANLRDSTLEDAALMVERLYTGNGGVPDDPHPDVVLVNGTVHQCAATIRAMKGTPQ